MSDRPTLIEIADRGIVLLGDVQRHDRKTIIPGTSEAEYHRDRVTRLDEFCNAVALFGLADNTGQALGQIRVAYEHEPGERARALSSIWEDRLAEASRA